MNVRIVDFTEDRATAFARLYQGLRQTTKQREQRPLAMLRAEGSILKKLEEISADDPEHQVRLHCRSCGALGFEDDFVPRRLMAFGPLEVTTDELKVLTEYPVAVAWTTKTSLEIADAIDWVSMAPDKAAYDKVRAAARLEAEPVASLAGAV